MVARDGKRGFNANWKQDYERLSGTAMADASEITRKLLQIVQNNDAEAWVDSRRHIIRIRTIKDKPAVRIMAYTREVPEVWIHPRTRRDYRKAAEFFVAASLKPEDWKQDTSSHGVPSSAAYKYVGDLGNLLPCVERALRVLLHDAF